MKIKIQPYILELLRIINIILLILTVSVRQLYAPFFSKISYLILAINLINSIILLFYRKYKLKDVIPIILAVIVSLYAIVMRRNAYFLIFFLVALTCVNLDRVKMIKTVFFTQFSFFCIIVLLSLLKIIPSNYETIAGTLNYKNSLGFVTGNYCFAYFMSTYIAYFLMRYRKLNYKETLVSVAICLVLYWVTHCRTGLIVFGAAVLINVFYSLIKLLINYKLLLVGLLIIFSVSIIFPVLFNEWDVGINKLVSNRFYYWFYYIRNFNFWGSSLEITNQMPLDNYYLTLLFAYGVIVFAFSFIIFIYSVKRLSKQTQIAFIMLFLYMFFEASLKIFFAPTLVLLFTFYERGITVKKFKKRKQIGEFDHVRK